MTCLPSCLTRKRRAFSAEPFLCLAVEGMPGSHHVSQVLCTAVRLCPAISPQAPSLRKRPSVLCSARCPHLHLSATSNTSRNANTKLSRLGQLHVWQAGARHLEGQDRPLSPVVTLPTGGPLWTGILAGEGVPDCAVGMEGEVLAGMPSEMAP